MENIGKILENENFGKYRPSHLLLPDMTEYRPRLADGTVRHTDVTSITTRYDRVQTEASGRHVRQLVIKLVFSTDTRRPQRQLQTLLSQSPLRVNLVRDRLQTDQRHTILLLATDQRQLHVFCVLPLSLSSSSSKSSSSSSSSSQ